MYLKNCRWRSFGLRICLQWELAREAPQPAGDGEDSGAGSSMENPVSHSLSVSSSNRIPPWKMQSANRSRRYKIIEHFTGRTIQLQTLWFWVGENGILVGGSESVVVVVAVEPLQSEAMDDGISRLHRSPILKNRNRLKEERHLQFRRGSFRANHRKRGFLLGEGSDFDFNFTSSSSRRRRN